MKDLEYTWTEAEKEFGSTAASEVRALLKENLGHNNFSVIRTHLGLRIRIFES